MRIAIDSAGRLVIPKALREAAGIFPGTQLHICVRDGRIEIEPAPLDVSVRMEAGVAVAVAKAPVPALSAQHIADILARMREERC